MRSITTCTTTSSAAAHPAPARRQTPAFSFAYLDLGKRDPDRHQPVQPDRHDPHAEMSLDDFAAEGSKRGAMEYHVGMIDQSANPITIALVNAYAGIY